jgi:hypothetical protein
MPTSLKSMYIVIFIKKEGYSMKKAQSAGSAATLVILIAGLILLYILFLPSEQRQELLGDEYIYPSSGTETTAETPEQTIASLVDETILSESPGRIYYLKESEYEHSLSAVNLYTLTESQVLLSAESLYVKNGIFDQLSRNITLNINDPDYTDNVLLTFSAEGTGRLTIKLNGVVVFDNEVSGTVNPIDLSDYYLTDVNTLEFSVSDVGYRFWTTNECQITNIQVSGDVTDISQQTSKTTFTVSDTEKFNLERARLYFYPDCNPREVGSLRINVNNQMVYDSIPDCQQINVVEFSPTALSAGDNYLLFKAEKGKYLIYSIAVKTELAEQEFPVYYFDIDEDAFIASTDVDRSAFEQDYECGDSDNYCPDGCGEDNDPDCCFESRNMYWCDVQPSSTEFRCTEISEADTSICSYCASGYEDKNGYAPSECDGLCGDDHDGYCAEGCSKYYDRDCCFDEDEDNFWCDHVPQYGLENTCETSLSEDECKDCEYESQGQSYTDFCPSEAGTKTIDIYEFYPGYETWIVFTFVDEDETKTANVYVNGHKFYLDTKSMTYERQVTDYIEPGSNAVKIEPTRSLEIRKLEVIVKKAE